MIDAHYHRGGYATFLSPSVHIRDTENDIEETNDRITYLAPVAEGTAYAYDTMMGYYQD